MNEVSDLTGFIPPFGILAQSSATVAIDTALDIAIGLQLDSNRDLSDSAHETPVLHANLNNGTDSPAAQAASYAPFVWHDDDVKRVWGRLSARVAKPARQAPSRTVTTDPELHLVIEGRTHRPLSVSYGCYSFVVRKGVNEVRLVSRAGIPAEARPWLDDRRLLGVSVERIALRSGANVREVPVDLPDLQHLWTPPWEQGKSPERPARRLGADICPASDAAIQMPRARMGVREPGPNQSRVLEALCCKLDA